MGLDDSFLEACLGLNAVARVRAETYWVPFSAVGSLLNWKRHGPLLAPTSVRAFWSPSGLKLQRMHLGIKGSRKVPAWFRESWPESPSIN